MKIKGLNQIANRIATCALAAGAVQITTAAFVPPMAFAQQAATLPADAITLDGTPISPKFLGHGFTIKPYKGMRFFMQSHGAGRKYSFVSFPDEPVGRINFEIRMFVTPKINTPQMAEAMVQNAVSVLQKQMTQATTRPFELPLAGGEKAVGYELAGRAGKSNVDVFCVGLYKPGVIYIMQGTDLAQTYPVMRKKVMAMLAGFSLSN
jgi:hypothetical protein